MDKQGPIGESVKDSAAKTGSDFIGLADSKAPPSQGAATGQPLTRELHVVLPYRGIETDEPDYHSFFYSLLSVSALTPPSIDHDKLTSPSGNIPAQQPSPSPQSYSPSSQAATSPSSAGS
jgi:hypothetical protein